MEPDVFTNPPSAPPFPLAVVWVRHGIRVHAPVGLVWRDEEHAAAAHNLTLQRLVRRGSRPSGYVASTRHEHMRTRTRARVYFCSHFARREAIKKKLEVKLRHVICTGR